MTARAGRLLLISVYDGVSAFDDLIQLRTNDFTVNDETVDITTKGSVAGWRELLPGAGIKTMSMSGEGVHRNEAAVTRLTTIADTSEITQYRVLSGTGEKWEGNFQLTTYNRSGAYNDAEAFSINLENSGPVAYARLKDTIAGQDETDYDGTGLNGEFVGGDGAGGTAYVVSETITLSDGTVITVDAVDGNDDVTQFTVTTASTTSFYYPEVTLLTQSSTSGTGTGFTLTVGNNNVANI